MKERIHTTGWVLWEAEDTFIAAFFFSKPTLLHTTTAPSFTEDCLLPHAINVYCVVRPVSKWPQILSRPDRGGMQQWNTSNNRYDGGSMNLRMVILLHFLLHVSPYSPLRLHRSRVAFLPPTVSDNTLAECSRRAGGLWSRERRPFPAINRLCSGIIRGPGDNHRFCSEIVIHHNEYH